MSNSAHLPSFPVKMQNSCKMSLFDSLEGCFSCQTPLFRAVSPSLFPCHHYAVCLPCQIKSAGYLSCGACRQCYPCLQPDPSLSLWQGNIQTIRGLQCSEERKEELNRAQKEWFLQWRWRENEAIPRLLAEEMKTVEPVMVDLDEEFSSVTATVSRNSQVSAEPMAIDIEGEGLLPRMGTVEQVNREKFGNSDFRPIQLEAITAVLEGKDVFLCMPTGSGKSLCYQLPACLSTGLTIVVMPLLALIRDQRGKLNKVGIRSVCFMSGQSKEVTEQTYEAVESDPALSILFLTPEKLAKSDRVVLVLQRLYSAGRLARLVVDEAHCVSKWGRTFREDYLRLSDFRTLFPTIPIVAMTATATKRVKEDVSSILGLKDPVYLKSDFNRPNLFFSVRPKTFNVMREIGTFLLLSHPGDCGLIYCLSRKDTELVAAHLASVYKLSITHYHAKLTSAERLKVERRWKAGEVLILASTIAFGMGIDKSDVRFVIHHSMPMSLDNYIQEAGRAGRDGAPADCILYYTSKDISRNKYLLLKSTKQEDTGYGGAISDLEVMSEYCEEKLKCRREVQMEFLGEAFDSGNCMQTCDNCQVGLQGSGDVRDFTAYAKAVVELIQVTGSIRYIRDLPYQLSEEASLSPALETAAALLQTLTALEIRTLGRKLFAARIIRYLGTKKTYSLALDFSYIDLIQDKIQVKFQPPLPEPVPSPTPVPTRPSPPIYYSLI